VEAREWVVSGVMQQDAEDGDGPHSIQGRHAGLGAE